MLTYLVTALGPLSLALFVVFIYVVNRGNNA
jgi:hypothetical protein